LRASGIRPISAAFSWWNEMRFFPLAALIAALLTAGLSAAPKQRDQRGARTEPPPDSTVAEPWNGGRYRLMPNDVFELIFPYVPEFNQVLTVQPDGYVNLRAVSDLNVQGHTVPEIREMLVEVYRPILKDPVVTILLKEFEKPYFIAAG